MNRSAIIFCLSVAITNTANYAMEDSFNTFESSDSKSKANAMCNDVQNLFLYAPNGSLVSTYPVQKVSKTPNYVKSISSTSRGIYTDSKSTDINTEIDLDNLGASVGNKNVPNNYLPLIGLATIILIAVGAAVLAYRKSPQGEGISEISSSDIKIIE